MGETTKMLVNAARVLVAIGAGILLAWSWQEYRPMDRENWGMLFVVWLVATIVVYLLLHKLAKTGPD
ncbi:MAG: hypothetical protein QXH27_00785 [Candidatus Micrarchaeia archaeon]